MSENIPAQASTRPSNVILNHQWTHKSLSSLNHLLSSLSTIIKYNSQHIGVRKFVLVVWCNRHFSETSKSRLCQSIVWFIVFKCHKCTISMLLLSSSLHKLESSSKGVLLCTQVQTWSVRTFGYVNPNWRLCQSKLLINCRNVVNSKTQCLWG